MADDQNHDDENIVHYEGGIPVFNTRLNNLENEAREAKNRDSEYKDEQLRLNRRLVWFTGVLAVVGIAGGFISSYQTRISGINAAAAKANAEAARGMVEEMKQTRLQAASDSAKSINAQQAIAQQGLTASQQASDKSFAATVVNFQLDQRAWIGIDNMAGIPKKGDLLNIRITIKNTGKTPARLVRLWKHSQMLPELPDIYSGCKSALPSNPKGPRSVMNPGGFFLTGSQPFPEPLPSDIKDVLGSWSLYVYGCVTYEDIFYRPHWLTFCSYWQEAGQGYEPCDRFNDTGDGKFPKAK